MAEGSVLGSMPEIPDGDEVTESDACRELVLLGVSRFERRTLPDVLDIQSPAEERPVERVRFNFCGVFSTRRFVP